MPLHRYVKHGIMTGLMNTKTNHRAVTVLCVFLAAGLFAWGMQQTLAVDCVGKPYGTPGCPLKSTEPPPPTPKTCGNGVLDDGEECDLGKSRNGYSNCTTGCMLLYCGDGLTTTGGGEECDPADPALNQVEEVYVKDPSDPKGESYVIERHYLQPSCGSICTAPVCDEQSNCNGGCKRKFLQACPAGGGAAIAATTSTPSTNASVAGGQEAGAPQRCGDGTIQAGEECDDGDTVNTNQCTNECRSAVCGDNIVQTWEQCDDGNKIDGDECSNVCKLAACGDGLVQNGEECDDGNQLSGDQCTNSCKLPRCGDGIMQNVEECDDGNGVDVDGCTNKCTRPRCGDGVLQAGEECDDGNTTNDDACSNNCRQPRCGDGILQAGEECDDGNRYPSDGCNNLCKLPVCGNAAVEPGEECDDGNKIDGDNCTNRCTRPRCGDGVLQAGEECDDSNMINDDSCSNSCHVLRCGDGILQAGEECDDGRLNSNTKADACRKNCQLPHCGDRVTDSDEDCDGSEECSKECKAVHAAAPALPPASSISGGAILLILGGTGFLGMLGAIAYFARGKFGKRIGKVVRKGIASIDDIPLDEIEMPWHRW